MMINTVKTICYKFMHVVGWLVMFYCIWALYFTKFLDYDFIFFSQYSLCTGHSVSRL
jgi:hypothetical protein